MGEKMNLQQLVEHLQNKKVVCFGTGIQGTRMVDFLEDWNIQNNLVAYIDNNEKKIGTFIISGEKKYPIISFEKACEIVDDETFVLITSLYYKDIYKQIEENSISKKWECISIDEVAEAQLLISDYSEIQRESDIPLIPKKIHYIWLGQEKPKELQQNIEKWKEMCPDYEFYEWNDDNFDVTINNYMKQAYDREKWEFVSDYMRLEILYKYGGIYLDTDIEMLKRPDDLLYQKCFACTDASLVMNLGSGVGAMPGCEIIKELRDYYKTIDFVKEDGSIDKTSCNTHSYNVLKKYGFKVNDSLQKIKEMNIYPMIFQGACSHTRTTSITPKTYWIHYSNMGWMKEVI